MCTHVRVDEKHKVFWKKKKPQRPLTTHIGVDVKHKYIWGKKPKCYFN
jgi:hypothetical protein